MKLAVMQPYLFPYIGYFQLINFVDVFVILDDVNFINRGWINRNRILIDGKEKMFSVPLRAASQNKLINQIELEGNMKWNTKFLKTIRLAYSKAPFFEETLNLIEQVITNPEMNLSLYIYSSLKLINKHLDIGTVIRPTSAVYLNRELKAQDKISDICIKEQAAHYINLSGGIGLYNRDHFKSNGIELSFLKSKEIDYKQFNSDFIPWLSIIDVLMFNSKDIVKKYLLMCEFV